MNRNKGCTLIFDYFCEERNLSAVFRQPIKIITTKCPKEVHSCLIEIERYICEGYYVAGFFSYEAINSLYPSLTKQVKDFPLLWFGVFKKPFKKQQNLPSGTFTISPWKANLSKDEYKNVFNKLQTKINKEQIQQINYTIQMKSKFIGNPYSYYKQLRKAQEANYSAYLSIGKYSILSISPELFFHIKNQKITTKPMKGTASRGLSYLEDQRNAHWLKNSKKNRKENKLSVNRMKEELSKISQPGTIKVPKKYEIEQYPTVFQMTSTVTANLKKDVTVKQLFKTLFPATSITGIPKKQAIHLIDCYEKESRKIYCGAIGYFTPRKEAIFNVPIRTVLINRETKEASYGVGGAIMADSTVEEEYHEILTKSKVLSQKPKSFRLLETIGLINGHFIILKNHINRMKQSAQYFNFPIHIKSIKTKLMKISKKYSNGKYIVRILLDKLGEISIEVSPLTMSKERPKVTLAKKAIFSKNPFLYHKTTERSIYEKHHQSGVFDVLLWNENKEITEFTRGNVVFEKDGQFITPPVTCGLLPGTFREFLLKQNKLKERIVLKEDVHNYQKIYFINSVRGWIEVELI